MLKILFALLLTGCGYTARNNEIVGQVKKVLNVTPLVCSDFTGVDISLGVMKNGVGSMSHEDKELYVDKDENIKILKKALETGELVSIVYDTKRLTFCVPDQIVVSVKIIK